MFVDPSYLLMTAQTYWRGAMDPGTCDHFHHEWVAQTWYWLLVWAQESYS